MTDPNILLSKCITLLYRESQLENATENSSDLVKTAIDKLKINEVSLGLPSKRDVSLGLKNLVMEMARNEVTHTYDPVELLQQPFFRLVEVDERPVSTVTIMPGMTLTRNSQCQEKAWLR